MTDDELHHRILDAADGDLTELARCVLDYYADADRADRTSREKMYLHLGILTGATMRNDPERRRE